jgi:hypothetical protein
MQRQQHRAGSHPQQHSTAAAVAGAGQNHHQGLLDKQQHDTQQQPQHQQQKQDQQQQHQQQQRTAHDFNPQQQQQQQQSPKWQQRQASHRNPGHLPAKPLSAQAAAGAIAALAAAVAAFPSTLTVLRLASMCNILGKPLSVSPAAPSLVQIISQGSVVSLVAGLCPGFEHLLGLREANTQLGDRLWLQLAADDDSTPSSWSFKLL